MSETSETFFKKAGRLALTWVTVIASVATIFGLLLQARESKPRIDAIIQSRDRLTAPSAESKLSVSYSFENKPVRDLWKLKILMGHSGGQTIVGTGPRQNLIGSILPISLNIKCEILTATLELNEPNAKIEKISNNEIGLRFDQWREDESLEIILYLEASDGQAPLPVNFSSGRSIIDGEVNYRLPDDSGENQKKPAIDYLPNALAFTARIFVSLIGASAIIGGFVACVTAKKDYRKKKRDLQWQKLYRGKALVHLSTYTPPSSFELLKSEGFIVSDPSFKQLVGKTKEEFWASFDGPAPPSLKLLGSDTAISASELLGNIIGIIIVLFAGVLALGVTWAI